MKHSIFKHLKYNLVWNSYREAALSATNLLKITPYIKGLLIPQHTNLHAFCAFNLIYETFGKATETSSRQKPNDSSPTPGIKHPAK